MNHANILAYSILTHTYIRRDIQYSIAYLAAAATSHNDDCYNDIVIEFVEYQGASISRLIYQLIHTISVTETPSFSSKPILDMDES
jgi:peptidase E